MALPNKGVRARLANETKSIKIGPMTISQLYLKGIIFFLIVFQGPTGPQGPQGAPGRPVSFSSTRRITYLQCSLPSMNLCLCTVLEHVCKCNRAVVANLIIIICRHVCSACIFMCMILVRCIAASKNLSEAIILIRFTNL